MVSWSFGEPEPKTQNQLKAITESSSKAIGRLVSQGNELADQYFKQRRRLKSSRPSVHREVASTSGRYMALQVGTFLSQNSHDWGTDEDDVSAQFTAGVSYRLGGWERLMDLLFRGDFISFKGKAEEPLKLTLMPVIAFPDARSHFPIYFGAGAGVGLFLKNFKNESVLSLDYQIFGGVRIVDIIGSTGLSVEVGVKNHFAVLTDGHHENTFITLGTVSSF